METKKVQALFKIAFNAPFAATDLDHAPTDTYCKASETTSSRKTFGRMSLHSQRSHTQSPEAHAQSHDILTEIRQLHDFQSRLMRRGGGPSGTTSELQRRRKNSS